MPIGGRSPSHCLYSVGADIGKEISGKKKGWLLRNKTRKV